MMVLAGALPPASPESLLPAGLMSTPVLVQRLGCERTGLCRHGSLVDLCQSLVS